MLCPDIARVKYLTPIALMQGLYSKAAPSGIKTEMDQHQDAHGTFHFSRELLKSDVGSANTNGSFVPHSVS